MKYIVLVIMLTILCACTPQEKMSGYYQVVRMEQATFWNQYSILVSGLGKDNGERWDVVPYLSSAILGDVLYIEWHKTAGFPGRMVVDDYRVVSESEIKSKGLK